MNKNEPEVHTMELSQPWFNLIAQGVKTIEGRPNDEKRQEVNEGDIIIFTEKHNPQNKIMTMIIERKDFVSFEQALKFAKLKNILPGFRTINEGLEKVYYNIPGYIDKEKKYGVVLFYLQLL